MRLLEIILTLEQGGAQSLLLEKARYLQSQSCFVLIVAFYDGATHADFDEAGIPVILIRPKRYPVWVSPLFLLELRRIRMELAAIINQYQIQIVQSHLLSLYDFILPTLHEPNLKARLWTFHSTVFEIRRYDRSGLKTRFYSWIYPFFAKRIDAIVAVSEGVKRSLEVDFGFQKIRVIENAIPVEKFRVIGERVAFCRQQNIPQDAKIFLSIGRLTKQKGYAYLLEAFAKLHRLNPNIYLCLVGEGDLEDSLKAQNTPNTLFLGWRHDIPEVLASVDIFVISSLWEGLSQALLEAMAARKAIIATKVSGTIQVIQDGENGLLVEPGDVESLFYTMQSMLNGEVAKRLGEAAYQTVRERYDIARLGQDYLRLYQSLIGTTYPYLYNNL